MSKTFTGTVSFDFSLTLSTESVTDIMEFIQEHVASGMELDEFQKYVVGCETDDERITALWKRGMREQFKGYLQGVHEDTAGAGNGDSFRFSPITIKVKGKA